MDSHSPEPSCSQRRFPLHLASWLPARYASYLRWLSHLIDRLGADRALALWEEVYRDYDEQLTLLKLLTVRSIRRSACSAHRR